MKLRFNLLIKVEPIFVHIKKSHTSHSKRDFLFICENERVCIKMDWLSDSDYRKRLYVSIVA